jgi:serine/threonine-protein phosphatase 2A regulatory subunit A
LTALFGIAALAEQLNFEMIKRSFLPVLQTMQKDPVANVRMNVAKSIEAILPAIKGSKDLNVSSLPIFLMHCCRTLPE